MSLPPPPTPARARRWPVAAGVLGLLALLALTVGWLLFQGPASSKRPVAPVPLLTLPPPPPPPPEPEPTPEPEVEPEEVMPEPEPLEDVPKPTEQPPTPDTADPVTMNADAQAGSDSFGIQSGSGGGMRGTGAGGAGNAAYGRYLGYVLQQAVAREERLRPLAFQLTLNVWLDPGGELSRVELVRGSGNPEADQAVLAAIRAVGRLDERPPASLAFPARVLVQGRRPAG